MKGNRVYVETADALNPGDYAFIKGCWWVCLPVKPFDADSPHCWVRITGNESCNWEVTEHEDHAITVLPSMRTQLRGGIWHGYLQHGIWLSLADTTVKLWDQ